MKPFRNEVWWMENETPIFNGRYPSDKEENEYWMLKHPNVEYAVLVKNFVEYLRYVSVEEGLALLISTNHKETVKKIILGISHEEQFMHGWIIEEKELFRFRINPASDSCKKIVEYQQQQKIQSIQEFEEEE